MKSNHVSDRGTLALVVAIAALALAIRLIYLVQLRRTPLFDAPGLDAAYYLATARAIAAGDWLGSEVFFMGPLYPYFLAVVGLLTDFSLTAMRAVQILLGTFSVLLVLRIGTLVFDLRTGALAAFGLAAYGIAIFYDNLFLMTSLVLVLGLAILLDLLTLPAVTPPRRLVLSGTLLGVAALARASILVFVPAVLAWLWTREHRAGKRRRWRPLVAYGAGLALVLGLTLTRNVLVGGDWVPITSNGGLNLFIGNNPIGRGTYLPLDGVARAAGVDLPVDVSWMVDDPAGRRVAEAAMGRQLKPSEVSRFYTERTLDYVREQPERALEILGRKLLLFWNATEIAQIEDPALHRELVPLWRWPLVGFGLVGPLALAGMVIGLREFRRYALLYLFVLAYTFSIVLFFVTARYRLPVVPVLLLFAAHAVWWLIDRARELLEQGVKRPAPIAAVALALAVATWIVHLDLVRIDRAAALIHLGIAHAQNGDHAAAIDAFERAVAEAPGDPTSRYNLAFAYLADGQLERARGTFRSVLEVNARSTEAWIGLSQVEQASGNPRAASEAMRHAAELTPERHELWLELGKLEHHGGRPDSALTALERATRTPSARLAGQAWELLMRLHMENQRFGEALAAARRAAELVAPNPTLSGQLGMLEAMHGHPEAAAAAFRQALAIDPRHLPARLGMARLLLSRGLADSARAELAIARRLAPADPRIEALERELADP